MTRILLVRGMLAGFVAGLLVFALARCLAEPEVERAIAFEASINHAKDEAPDSETVSRKTQRNLGLLTGTLAYGTAIGGIFGLTFAFALGRIAVQSARVLSCLLAALGFVSFVVVPTLKYPASPPSVGNPDTIGIRTLAFFLLIAFSVSTMVLAVQIEHGLRRRFGAWNAALLAALTFVAILALVSHFLPEFDEVPAGFSATLLWRFRVVALEMQVLMWSVLGFFFGWLVDREFGVPRQHAQ